MATMQSAQLEPAMIEAVDKTLNKHFEEKIKVTKRVSEGGPINTRGRRVVMYIDGNNSFNWFSEAGAYATPLNTTDIEGKIYPVRCSAGFEFSGTYYRQAGSAESLLKGLSTLMARTQTSAAKKFEQAFLGTNTGEIGVVLSRDSGTQFTASITYAGGSLWGARKLKRGVKVNFYSSAGAQRTTGTTSATISATTPPVQSTGVVVTSDTIPTDVVATDIIVYGDSTTAGSFGKAPNGLRDFVANSGVIQGQSRASYPELASYVDDAGGAAISQIRLRKLTSAITTFRTEQESINFTMLSSRSQFDQFESQLLNLIRYTPGGEGRQELKPVFGDYEWMTTPDMEEDRVYFLDFSTFHRHDLKKWGRYNEDGLDWRLYFSNGAASDKFSGWIGWEGQFSCSQLNLNGLIKNFATPTTTALGYATVN